MHLLRNIAIMLTLAPNVSYGAAFQLYEHSAPATASAGTNQAEAKDAGSIFWNPASLTYLEDRSAAGVSHFFLTTAPLENVTAETTIGSIPTGGNNGGDAGLFTPAASLYYAKKLSPDASYGFAMTAPFGLGTRYDEGWKGRYHALESGLITVDLGLSGAYRVTPTLSLGLGIDAQYARGVFASAVDLSTVCLATSAVVPGLLAQCAGSGFATPGNAAADGRARVISDSWAPGWNAGLMWNASPDVRVGFAYRSKVSHELSGDLKITKPSNLPGVVSGLPALTNTRISTPLVLPESVAVSTYAQLSPKVGVMAFATWTHWSRISELRTKFENGAPDTVLSLQWKNTWRIGAGATYQITPAVTLRGGLAFDQSPTTSPSLQTLYVPDGDRWVAGLGASVVLKNKSTIDIGYTAYKFKAVHIETSSPVAGTFQGTFPSSYIHGLSIQYNMRL